VDQAVFDFGPVWDLDVVEHTFKIENAGQAPLQIKHVRSTCGCTAVDAKPQTLAPGASTDIRVRLTVAGLGGKVTKTVYVESNDPQTPNQALTLTGEVSRAISTVPPSVFLDRLDRTHPTTVEVALTNHLPEPMTISEVMSSVPNVSAKVSEVVKGKQFKVLLTATPPYTEGLLRGKITFKTGLPKKPEGAIEFIGRPPPPIEVQPSSVIHLGELNPDQEYVKSVRIVSTVETPFDIADVSTTNWRFSPVVKEVREGREYELTITARPPYEWGANRASIVLGTRSAAMPRLSVQVFGELPSPIRVNPSTLLFRDLTTTQGGQASVTLHVEGQAPVEILSWRSSLPYVKPGVQVQEKGRSYLLTAVATPPLSPGPFQGEIVLETTHPRMKTMKVPVQSFPVTTPLPAVSVIPDAVLTLPPAGLTTAPSVSRLIVRANGSERVRVTNAVVSHKEITVRIEPQAGQEDRVTVIYLTVSPNATLRPQGEIITVFTDHKDFPQITRRIVRAGRAGPHASRPPTTLGQPYPVPGAVVPGAGP